jgi:PmbA protein
VDETQLRRYADMLQGRPFEWELYAVDGTGLSIEVRGGEVDAFKSSRNEGLAVRVLENGRMGFSFTSALSDDAFHRTVEQARASARAVEPNEFAAFATEALPVAAMELVDPAPPATTQERIDVAREIEAAALAADSRIKRVRKASFSESAGTDWLLNSHGLYRTSGGTFYSVSVLAIAEDGGESQSGGEFAFGRRWATLDYGRVGAEAARRALGQLGGRSLPTAPRTVIFENHVVADLLGVLASSFLGESVQRNRSMLAGKLGEPVMAPIVTLSDDALDARGSGASPFDGEGIPGQTTSLIEKGVLQTYLYDIETANRDGRKSTGNAGRGGFRGPPYPATSNLRLEPGTGSLVDLCAEVRSGLVITDLLGLHTANPISGAFSLGATGFEIVDGAVGRPVRGIAVADNVLGLFRKATRIGGDFRYFGSIGAASLVVPEVSVSGG